MRKILLYALCCVALLGAEKSMEELEKENKLLEMQLKNEKLKKRISRK